MSATAQKTDEQRLRWNAYMRQRWAKRTEEQKERTRQLQKRRYAKRYPKKAARLRERRKEDPEFFRKRRRASYLKRREKELQAHKVWVEKNRQRMNELNARRRALRVAATINLAGIQAFVASVKSKRTVRCYYCAKRIPSTSIHWDHIIPLSKGGQHAVENLCASCESCNLSKSAKPLAEWARTGVTQQLLNL